MCGDQGGWVGGLVGSWVWVCVGVVVQKCRRISANEPAGHIPQMIKKCRSISTNGKTFRSISANAPCEFILVRRSLCVLTCVLMCVRMCCQHTYTGRRRALSLLKKSFSKKNYVCPYVLPCIQDGEETELEMEFEELAGRLVDIVCVLYRIS